LVSNFFLSHNSWENKNLFKTASMQKLLSIWPVFLKAARATIAEFLKASYAMRKKFIKTAHDIRFPKTLVNSS
jgi:hypothetical protein